MCAEESAKIGSRISREYPGYLGEKLGFCETDRPRISKYGSAIREIFQSHGTGCDRHADLAPRCFVVLARCCSMRVKT